MTSDDRPREPGRIPEALLARAAELDHALREQGPGETYLFWEFDPPLLSEVGYRLTSTTGKHAANRGEGAARSGIVG